MVSKKILLVILAHGPEKELFERHTRLWTHHGLPILVLTTEDSPITTQFETIKRGHSGYTGGVVIDRLKQQYRYLTELNYDWFVIHQADSFCLSKEMPEYLFKKLGLTGNIHVQGSEQMNKFHWYDSVYPTQPWIFDKQTLINFCNNGEKENSWSQYGVWDMWMGMVCKKYNITMYDFLPNENTCRCKSVMNDCVYTAERKKPVFCSKYNVKCNHIQTDGYCFK